VDEPSNVASEMYVLFLPLSFFKIPFPDIVQADSTHPLHPFQYFLRFCFQEIRSGTKQGEREISSCLLMDTEVMPPKQLSFLTIPFCAFA
jgi:hypothetical protein